MPLLLAIVGGFAGGIFFASVLPPTISAALFLVVLAGVCSIAAWRTRRFAYVLLAVFFIASALGVGRMLLLQETAPTAFQQDVRHRVSYTGTVVSNPDLRDSTQRVVVRIENGAAHTQVLVVTKRYPTLTVGDMVRVWGTLSTPSAFTSNDGRTFHYDQYLAKDGVYLELNFASIEILQHAPWYSLTAFLSHAKQSFLRGINTALPEPFASFAGGIVIGGKSGLGAELEDAFIRSGLVQIIVLSGYNIMVVAEWVMVLLQSLRVPRQVRALAGAAALLLFVGMAGLSATAIRATLMALIALYARATGRTYVAGRALVVTIGLMLLYSPLSLVYDPGFDLSVAATAGLIWLAPILETQFAYIKNTYWKNALATTLAAQIAVLPLLLYETGNLSFVSIPANLAVIAVMPLAMGVSALAGIGGVVFGNVLPIASIVLGMPAYLVSAYCIWIAKTSAALPGSAALVPAFPFAFVVLLYALLIYAIAAKRSATTDQLRLLKNASR